MSKYRFVGVSSRIGGEVELTEYGQVIELSRDEARNAIEGGAALVPAEVFDGIGFTAEELEAYRYIGQRGFAPAEFQAKHAEALRSIRVAAGQDATTEEGEG